MRAKPQEKEDSAMVDWGSHCYMPNIQHDLFLALLKSTYVDLRTHTVETGCIAIMFTACNAMQELRQVLNIGLKQGMRQIEFQSRSKRARHDAGSLGPNPQSRGQ